ASSILNPLSFVELSVQVYRSPVVDSDVDAKFVGAGGADPASVVWLPALVAVVVTPSPFLVVIVKL
ncbi:MAG: hypothetical protein AAB834_07895, partial [Patescibacteria group bacterium]